MGSPSLGASAVVVVSAVLDWHSALGPLGLAVHLDKWTPICDIALL